MKLPRTKHIEGSRGLSYAKDPDCVKFKDLIDKNIIIEEKIDGAGVSIYFDDNLKIHLNHRDSKAIGKEYDLLYNWIYNNENILFNLLEDKYILFGEWIYNKHTIFYNTLPSYFFESDIYDKEQNIFLSTDKRKRMLESYDIIQVPVISNNLNNISNLLSNKSLYKDSNWKNDLKLTCKYLNLNYDNVINSTDNSDLMEGLYVKHEDNDKVIGRYKYIRSEFLSTILKSKSHVLDRNIIPNKLKV